MFGTASKLGVTPPELKGSAHDDDHRADVAAKRAIIAAAFEDGATIDSEWGCCHDPEAIRRACMEADGLDCYGVKHAEAAMKLLIQPFADHPDFNPTWRV